MKEYKGRLKPADEEYLNKLLQPYTSGRDTSDVCYRCGDIIGHKEDKYRCKCPEPLVKKLKQINKE